MRALKNCVEVIVSNILLSHFPRTLAVVPSCAQLAIITYLLSRSQTWTTAAAGDFDWPGLPRI